MTGRRFCSLWNERHWMLPMLGAFGTEAIRIKAIGIRVNCAVLIVERQGQVCHPTGRNLKAAAGKFTFGAAEGEWNERNVALRLEDHVHASPQFRKAFEGERSRCRILVDFTSASVAQLGLLRELPHGFG